MKQVIKEGDKVWVVTGVMSSEEENYAIIKEYEVVSMEKEGFLLDWGNGSTFSSKIVGQTYEECYSLALDLGCKNIRKG